MKLEGVEGRSRAGVAGAMRRRTLPGDPAMPLWALRGGLFVSTAFASALFASDAARAACTPAAANGVTATCIGATTDQGPDVGVGYGGAMLTDFSVMVASGASVIGSNSGLRFSTGDAVNYGTITGFNGGIWLGSGTVNNFGKLEAVGAGIWSDADATVVNSGSGSITGGANGIVSVAELTLTNSGRITGGANIGVYSNGSAAVNNSGSITGGADGVVGLVELTLTNSGRITGEANAGAGSNGSATVVNSGMIGGVRYGIQAAVSAVTNSGTIVATGSNGRGVNSGSTSLINSGVVIASGSNSVGVRGYSINVVNSGAIAGAIGAAAVAGGGALPSQVVNSGTIIGYGGTAVQFLGSATGDSLTVLPGARFGGLVDFGGGADRVRFGTGSWILDTANFNTALSTVTTAGTPYVVEPNRIVVADLSGFGAMNRAIMDITGWISSVLPESPVIDPVRGGASAFAAIESAAPRADDAFANFPSVLPYVPTPVFKGGVVNDRFGNSFWAKGFGGRREQSAANNFIGNVTTGYGGAFGYDRTISPDLMLGAFMGGSTSETRLDLNAGRTDTDTLFGGAYVRAFFGASFLDLALIGGKLDNDAKRNIGGGPAFQTASASYGGWFINPLVTLGHAFALDNGLTLTPAFKVRYVAAHFDGYAETGSTANLTVAGRDMQAFEERAELTLANVQYWNDNRITWRMTGGALARQHTGDANVNAILLGTNFIAATPDKKNVAGLYGSWGIDWQVGRVALFAVGEIAGMNDQTTTFAGRGGMRVVW